MHDLLIRGGIVHDGFGSEGRAADVAVDGDRVVAIGTDLGPARRTLDAEGLLVAPGFVDPHSHSDTVPFLADAQPFKLLQGVTTEIIGNCGFSCAPIAAGDPGFAPGVLADIGFDDFGGYLDAAEAAGPSNNLAALVGHNTLRLRVGGMESELSPRALQRMCDLANAAFDAGAFGFSSGLEYVPGAYAPFEELVALAATARRWNGTYATHMRNENEGLAAALDEAIAVAEAVGLRVQISHCKASGRSAWGLSAMLLDRLGAARRRGVDLRADVYPYLAFGTGLVAVLPPVACEGGEDALLARLADPRERARLRSRAEDPVRSTGAGLWRELTPEDVQIIRHVDPKIEGRRLSEVLDGRDPWDAVCDVLSADPHADGVFHTMHDEDLERMMRDPLIAIGSDNGPPVGPNHPRTFGTFPRFFGEYVRSRGVVPVAEAIRKATSATAQQFGLADRGWLGTGAVADIAVFDLDRMGHDGDFQRPDVRPTGVEHIVLNGSVVVMDGDFTGARGGRMLRRGRS